MLDQISSLFNRNNEGVMTSTGSLKQLLNFVDTVVSKTDFINTKMSINLNSTFLFNICLFHNPTDDLLSTTDRFLHMIETSTLWTLVTVNSVIRKTVIEKKEQGILETIIGLDDVVDKSSELESKMKYTLRSNYTLDGRTIPFFFKREDITSLIRALHRYKTNVYRGALARTPILLSLFNENSLTLAAIFYTTVPDTVLE